MPNFKIYPIVIEVAYQAPKDIFERFAKRKWSMLLDSANAENNILATNRYSYILLSPFSNFVYAKHLNALELLRQKSQAFKLSLLPHLPPFQGGMVGYLSYDLVHDYSIKIKTQGPLICIGFYDLLLSFDHFEKKAYIVASGFPELDEDKRKQRARKRLNWLKAQLEMPYISNSWNKPLSEENIVANFSKSSYMTAVEKVIEHIKDGDIFQANIAQRFAIKAPKGFDYYALYKKLTKLNPAPFAAYLNLGKYKLISASPERFIKLNQGNVETRPIKGTRARGLTPKEDEANKLDLLQSAKDLSENTMIVDLMRNDLSKVCEDDSVQVQALCAHESHPTVHHLVSVIVGKLRKEFDVYDLLRATLPGGSITGAPKIRAMQIINAIEPDPRGAYCGNIVMLGFDGSLDSSIIIRTFVVEDDLITFHAGGAVVLDSCSLEEYKETLSKSFALKMALCR